MAGGKWVEIGKVPCLQGWAHHGSSRSPAHHFNHGQPVLGASLEIRFGGKRAARQERTRAHAAKGGTHSITVFSDCEGKCGRWAVDGGDNNCGDDTTIHWCAGDARMAVGGLAKRQSNLGDEHGRPSKPGLGSGEFIQLPNRFDSFPVNCHDRGVQRQQGGVQFAVRLGKGNKDHPLWRRCASSAALQSVPYQAGCRRPGQRTRDARSSP